MTTTLDAVISRLLTIRDSIGGKCHVRIQETPSVSDGHLHSISDIGIYHRLIYSGDEKIVKQEVVFIPYLATQPNLNQ